MTIEEKLKELIIARYGSIREFTRSIDMANSTFATIMKKGVHKANVSNIIKICQELGISTDEIDPFILITDLICKNNMSGGRVFRFSFASEACFLPSKIHFSLFCGYFLI